ncbi:MAG: NADH-quinone oxidoreductase subunit NuoG [Lautropia sp.]
MVEVEIDGRKVEVAEGSMLMHAANALGIYVPHFCYHKKLTIAANCRMCLVEVEKAPKPLPACATPVSAGMKAFTKSPKAIKAQQGVMEFLLINHPLDCPICDQGGECQLQDLAVGYGDRASRYGEEKRVVFHKNLGPLIAAEEMARCIQCTRCVRFGQEVAGVMELGMVGRGEHSEILSFLGRTIDSELSGNMIDVCPVGALTSKPFRFQARTWELTRRRSVAPHDSLGSNIIVQVKQERVLRVLPFENEAVNECWLSDRDRFSYEAIDAPDRLLAPMIKQDGRWQEVAWETALDYVAHALGDVRARHGAESIGLLASPNSTTEELYLAGALMRGIGSDNVDFRLRQSDFSLDAARAGVPWLGHAIADVGTLDALLIVGSFLRKDHPLLSARVRQAAKTGTRVLSVQAIEEDWLMPMAARITTAPDRWVTALIEVLVACARSKEGAAVPDIYRGIEPSAEAAAVAAALAAGDAKAIWLGNAVVQHPAYGAIARVAQAIAELTGARLGVIGEAANTVGGHLVGALPKAGGLNARAMLAQPRQAYLLFGIEPSLDCGDPVAAKAALGAAGTVVAATAFKSDELLELADCLLPIVPFAETGGSYINCEGRLQTFNGVVRPQGQARPGWKVLRVLGNGLDIAGFDFDSVEEVRAAALEEFLAATAAVPAATIQADPAVAATGGDEVVTPAMVAVNHGPSRPGGGRRAARPVSADGRHFEARLNNAAGGAALPPPVHASAPLQRLADVPIYFADALVRRAPSLQRTADAAAPAACASGATLERLGIADGDAVRAVQGGGSALLVAHRDDRLADGVVRIAAAHPSTAGLPALFGALTLEPT